MKKAENPGLFVPRIRVIIRHFDNWYTKVIRNNGNRADMGTGSGVVFPLDSQRFGEAHLFESFGLRNALQLTQGNKPIIEAHSSLQCNLHKFMVNFFHILPIDQVKRVNYNSGVRFTEENSELTHSYRPCLILLYHRS